MLVYHGSVEAVSAPYVIHSRRQVDFGPGFYVTPIYEQAAKWAAKYKLRGRTAVVSSYELDENALSALPTLNFEGYTESWLDFVLQNRSGSTDDRCAVIIGGVANDKVFNTVELFLEGLIDKGEALKRLRYEKPNLQICFRTQEAIDRCLTYRGSESL